MIGLASACNFPLLRTCIPSANKNLGSQYAKVY
jgi:hypothetical protein